MKLYIRAAEDYEYRPGPFIWDDVDKVSKSIIKQVTDVFSRRWKHIEVETDDEKFNDNRIEMAVYVYRKDNLLIDGHFTYSKRTEYSDEEDYEFDLQTGIEEFARALKEEV